MSFLDFASQYVPLRKSGKNMVGPCPKCGGDSDSTRFVVNTAKDFGHCYQCSWNADTVRLLRDLEGLSCPEAHRTAGIICDRPECPAWDGCSLGKGKPARRDERGTPAVRDRERRQAEPVAAESPADCWQRHAMEMVNRCHERLLASPEQLDYLGGRGLPREAVERYRLGWIPELEFKNRKAWGLENKWDEDRQKWITALPFFKGILIPWIIDGHVHRLRIRKSVVTGPKDPRYIWVDGSGNDIICLNHQAQAHCVVESDLDGLLVDWVAGDLVGAVPLGSCSTHPKATVHNLLQRSLRILVALDFDGEIRNGKVHAPGGISSRWWFEHFPAAARRWPVPVGKDPGEAFQAGADLRAWIVAGLPPAMRLAALPAAPAVQRPQQEANPTVVDVAPPAVDPLPLPEPPPSDQAPRKVDFGAHCGQCTYMGWQQSASVCRHPAHPSFIESWPHRCDDFIDQDKKIMPGQVQDWPGPYEGKISRCA